MGCCQSDAVKTVESSNAPSDVPKSAVHPVVRAANAKDPPVVLGATEVKLDGEKSGSTSPVAAHGLSTTQSSINGRLRKSTISPIPLFVFKTMHEVDGKSDKLFLNVFIHKKVEKDHILIHNKDFVQDKKGESCYAYSVVLSEEAGQQCLRNEGYKLWTSESVVTVLNIVFGATIDLTKIKFPIMKKGFVGDSIPFFSLEKDIVSMKNPVLGSMKTDGESEGKGSNGGKRSIGDTVMHTLFGVLTQPSSPSSPSTSPRAVAHVETEDEHKVSAEDKDESSAVTHSDVVVSFPTGPAVVTHPSSHSATTSTGAATSHAAANVTTTSSVVAGASTAAAPDLTPLAPGRVYRQSSPKPIDDLYPSLSISQVAIPLRLTGWMKKQGHFAKTWKMRYFVLDRGMLTYYVDESASPPYGTEMKGQLCLAGYREQSLISNSETAATTAAAGQQAIDLTNTSASEVFDEVSSALQIQLRYYPNIVSPEIVDELNKDFGRCAPEQSHKELLMVCQSVAVKEAWLAALEAHTIYIETIALKFKQDMENNKGGTSSKPGSRSPSPAPSPKNREDASYSIISALSSFSRRDGNNNITSGRPKVSRASRQASMTLSSQKWAIFLNRNEKMVLAGLVEKPNPVGYRYMRNLLLVKYETPEDGDQAPVACRKRLIYIDSNSYEKKGEILWLEDAKAVHPTVVAKDDYFDVTDANGKSSRFYPKDDLSVARWIAEINGLPPV